MSDVTFPIEEEASDGDIARIAEGVVAHGRQRAQGDAKPLTCVVRANGRLLAGGHGRTEFGRLFVSNLWVDEYCRGQGLGSQILARMEQEAADRGCQDALIETLLDEVALMYGRRGYEPLAAIPGYVGCFTRHILIKQLRGATPA